jgi:hypothetical protein
VIGVHGIVWFVIIRWNEHFVVGIVLVAIEIDYTRSMPGKVEEDTLEWWFLCSQGVQCVNNGRFGGGEIVMFVGTECHGLIEVIVNQAVSYFVCIIDTARECGGTGSRVIQAKDQSNGCHFTVY